MVNPTRASINGEDVFVLVTPTELFQYVGAKANVLEKAKVTDNSPIFLPELFNVFLVGSRDSATYSPEEGAWLHSIYISYY